MIPKLIHFPNDLAHDFDILVATGQRTRFVLDAIKAKMAEPENVKLLAAFKAAKLARAQHNGKTGLPPSEILPAHRPAKKVLDVWE